MLKRLGLTLLLVSSAARAETLTGTPAYGDWHADAPGVTRLITPRDLPAPYATRSAGNGPSVADPKPGALPRVPEGFTVTRFAADLTNPRLTRVAPNGDIFVSETAAGRVRILRARDGAPASEQSAIFVENLRAPFGIAFHPPGPEPRFVYIATQNAIVRFAYQNGDLTARGGPETIVAELSGTSGGHTTRDVVFSADGVDMFVSVGSSSNAAEGLPKRTGEQIRQWEAANRLGAAWDFEASRANVLVFDALGKNRRVFATGLRNCVGMAVHPVTRDLWCSVNERDGLGDDLPPDYLTRVRDGAFYGWPWFYIGANEDPRHKGERPELAGKVTLPDVLLQPHSAPLQMMFYQAPPGAPAAFPPQYQGDGFVALHGSWNRAKRTGYKIARILLKQGVPSGEYQDFLTGFVANDSDVWGRPVGIAMARDGALLVTEDGNGTIWRVAPKGK